MDYLETLCILVETLETAKVPGTLWRLPKIFWGLSGDTLYNIGRDSARYDLEIVKDSLETARHSGDYQKHSGD